MRKINPSKTSEKKKEHIVLAKGKEHIGLYIFGSDGDIVDRIFLSGEEMEAIYKYYKDKIKPNLPKQADK